MAVPAVIRRRIVLLAVATFAVLGSSVSSPAPAQAFCSESEGCSPCESPRLVIDGKNTRLEFIYC